MIQGNECLMEIGRGSRIVLIEGMNGEIGCSEVESVVGRRGMDGVKRVSTSWKHVQKGAILSKHLFSD